MGSFSIINNISGISAQNQLNLNNINLSRTLMRLSSGKRINSGADDAAGLQIADSLRANTYALNQAVRNANDSMGVCQIADGALQQITNLLDRAVTLAEESATDTVDSSGRASMNAEFSSIQSEISRIAAQTNFNGMGIFTTGGINGSLTAFVGDVTGASSISVTISAITTSASSSGGGSSWPPSDWKQTPEGKFIPSEDDSMWVDLLGYATTQDPEFTAWYTNVLMFLPTTPVDKQWFNSHSGHDWDTFDWEAYYNQSHPLAPPGGISFGNTTLSGDLSTKTGAVAALTSIKDSLSAVSNMRANVGSGINRLQSAVAVLQTQSQNTAAAESTIRDANIAEEVANLTKYQILSQSGIAALAQANSRSQSVLSLLRG
jgi:flagellin